MNSNAMKLLELHKGTYQIKQRNYVKIDYLGLPRIKLVNGIWQVDIPANFQKYGDKFLDACFYAHAKNIEEGRYGRNS